MKKPIHLLTQCLCCDSDQLSEVLDLNVQPLANTLLVNPTDTYLRYPLVLNRCLQCGHGQLSHSVSPEILYKSYAYASGTSQTLNRYFDWFAQECADLLAPGASVLEIACNDGSLMRQLDARGLFTFGVDPAANITASVTGLRIENAMWPCSGRVGPYGCYDMVIAQNVLAHGPDPLGFLVAIRDILAEGGVCVIQTSQGRMLEGGQFDNIYHEHHSFFTVTSMAWLASRAGLRLRAVREISVHGGSLCWVLDRPEDECLDLGDFLKSGEFAVDRELPKFGSSGAYDLFAEKATKKIEYIRHAVESARTKGQEIAFVGYAAKAAVVLHASGIVPDHVYDEAVLKVGKYVPGVGKVVRPLSEIGQLENPYVVISAWNYRSELEAKVRKYRDGKVSSFLCYFPDVEEWS